MARNDGIDRTVARNLDLETPAGVACIQLFGQLFDIGIDRKDPDFAISVGFMLSYLVLIKKTLTALAQGVIDADLIITLGVLGTEGIFFQFLYWRAGNDKTDVLTDERVIFHSQEFSELSIVVGDTPAVTDVNNPI